MLLSSPLLLALSTLSLARAASLPNANAKPKASTCTPNFGGRAQTIGVGTSGVYAWTPESIFPGAHLTLQRAGAGSTLQDFLVQFTGQADGSFVLRLEAETNRYTALTAGRGGDLAFDILALASHPSQRFTIACQVCTSSSSTGARAQGCTVAHPASGSCVAGSAPGETLRLVGCSGAGGGGVYSFWDSH